MCRRVIIRELATTCSRMCSVTPMKRRLPWIPKKIKATPTHKRNGHAITLTPTADNYWIRKDTSDRKKNNNFMIEKTPHCSTKSFFSRRRIFSRLAALSNLNPIANRSNRTETGKTTSSVRLGRMDERILKLHRVLSSDQSN